jgi:hypothetical protein
MSYKQTDFPAIPAEQRSLVVAFANLLQLFDHSLAPDILYDTLKIDGDLDWWSVLTNFPDIDMLEMTETEGTWPSSSRAVVRFRRMDEVAAGPVDHYCVVADHRLRTIIDSLDGKIKSADTYGTVLGWASYDEFKPDVVAPEPAVTVAPKPEQRVTWYEVFVDDTNKPTYQPMHVVASGTRKYTFGNALEADDIKPTGPKMAENANVNIVAVAHVPIGDETRDYFMESTALGNHFMTTGRPAYTIGYWHEDLAEGHVERTKRGQIRPEIQKAIQEAEIAAAAQLEDKRQPISDVVPVDNSWKKYYPFPDPKPYVLKHDMLVADLDGRAPDVFVRGGYDVIEMGGWFEKNGVKYLRPQDSITSDDRNWYGIERKHAELYEPTDEPYTEEPPLVERATTRGVTTHRERYITIPMARAIARLEWIKRHFKTKK